MIALHCFYLLTQSEWLLSIRSCVFVRSHQSLSDKWFISVLRDTWLIIDRQATSYNFYFRVVFVSFRDRWALHKHEKKRVLVVTWQISVFLSHLKWAGLLLTFHTTDLYSWTLLQRFCNICCSRKSSFTSCWCSSSGQTQALPSL